MDEGILIALAAVYLLAPIALAVTVAIQASRRRALEEQVRRLDLQVQALGRRVAAQGGHQVATSNATATATASASATPTATPAATPIGEPILETTLPPPLLPREAPPPLPPPPPPPSPAPPARPPVRVDWESLVGVRLFSWVAGVALVLAGVFFASWSIEHGWLGPPVRAAIGTLCGLGLLVGAETRRARRYAVTAQSLAAGGVGILFATVFAAHARWDLVPALPAFGLLALVAAVAIAYAVRRESLTMALLGLVGGFATPVLVSTGEDRPIGLFGYLLLLNVGLAWVAHRRRWPLLGAVSLGLTALYQAGWVIRFLDGGNLPVGIVVFLVFPAFGFATLALSRRGAPGGALPPILRWTAALGAVPPALFLLRIAASPGLLAHWPLVLGFAVLLCAGLLVVAAVQGPEWLHLLGAGAATLALVAALDGGLAPRAWPGLLLPVLALAAVVLGGPLLLERRGRPFAAEGRFGTFSAPLLLGALALLPRRLAAADALLLAAAAALLAAAVAAAAVRARDGRLLAAGAALAPWAGLALALQFEREPLPPLALGLLLGAAGLGAFEALRRLAADDATRRRLPPAASTPWVAGGAAAFLVAGQLVVSAAGGFDPAPAASGPLLGLLLLGLLALAARTGHHGHALLAAASTFLACAAARVADRRAGGLAVVMVLWAIQVAVPWLQLRRGARARLLLWAPVAASGLGLVLVRGTLHHMGLPLLVGPAALLMALALVPHLLLLLRAPGGLQAERSRVVVVAGGILALVTAAVPLQLEDEWITIGWALLAAALAWLHARVPHRGLLAWVAALAALVTVRLVANPEVLHYHLRSGTPVWNFWLYAYGVPALSLLAASRLLPPGDDRIREGWPRLAPWLAAAGGLILFVLLNLEIADAFSEGPTVHLRLSGGLAYDLALTIGWAIFAVALLAVGIATRGRPARVAAIALLAVTVLKGFLLDLGSLSGLYRVGSFVGLAVCLSLVAVALQRFVLRGGEERT